MGLGGAYWHRLRWGSLAHDAQKETYQLSGTHGNILGSQVLLLQTTGKDGTSSFGQHHGSGLPQSSGGHGVPFSLPAGPFPLGFLHPKLHPSHSCASAGRTQHNGRHTQQRVDPLPRDGVELDLPELNLCGVENTGHRRVCDTIEHEVPRVLLLRGDEPSLTWRQPSSPLDVTTPLHVPSDPIDPQGPTEDQQGTSLLYSYLPPVTKAGLVSTTILVGQGTLSASPQRSGPPSSTESRGASSAHQRLELDCMVDSSLILSAEAQNVLLHSRKVSIRLSYAHKWD